MRSIISEALDFNLLTVNRAFDETFLSIASNTSQSTEFRYFIIQSLWSFHTQSPYDWWTREGGFAWTPEQIKNITVPTFVAKGQNDDLVGDNAIIAYHMLSEGRPNGKQLTTFHEFPTSLGAGEHCGIGAESYQAQVVFNWLADLWGISYRNCAT